ncbi:MAG: hypothetical protein H7222_14980 [Methylotenera sp.]|nr:hypothetical protein [Oligoflexia bacterium]
MKSEPEKSHWLQKVIGKISQEVPEVQDHAPVIVEKLATLLLTRLPRKTAAELLTYLPAKYSSLENKFHEEGDRTIGYSDFVEKTFYLIPWNVNEEIAFRVASCFLENILEEVPPEVRDRVWSQLPTEILVRMKLNRDDYKRCGKVAA